MKEITVRKDKILHKGKNAGLTHQDLEAGLLLHSFIYMFRSAHTYTCDTHMQACLLTFFI